jgi:hypothetical protein
MGNFFSKPDIHTSLQLYIDKGHSIEDAAKFAFALSHPSECFLCRQTFRNTKTGDRATIDPRHFSPGFNNKPCETFLKMWSRRNAHHPPSAKEVALQKRIEELERKLCDADADDETNKTLARETGKFLVAESRASAPALEPPPYK